MVSEPRVLVATGEGVATGSPDHCVMRLVLIKTANDPARALEEVADVANRTVATLREHGVTERDVQTSNLSVREDFDRLDKRTKTGHQAALELTVKTSSVEQTAPLLAAVAEAAGDSFSVQGFHLAIRDRLSLDESARRSAVADAAARAHQLAAAAAVTLGPIIEIAEGNVPRGRGGAFSARPASVSTSMPVEPGEVTSTVVVMVTYAIED